MSRKETKGCFLTCQDEEEDEPIIFNVPATYNEKVKVHNWQVRSMAEPRDNKDIFPPKGNLCVAAYNRLGSTDDVQWTTETKAMLEQIQLKAQYEPVYPQRSLLNVRTFAYAEQEEDKEDLRLGDLLAGPEVLGCTDYRSTMEIDYRLPQPLRPRPPPKPPIEDPWLLNRRAVGYTLSQLEDRKGWNTFLDDNMEFHLQAAEIKRKRRKAWEFSVNTMYEPLETEKKETIQPEVKRVTEKDLATDNIQTTDNDPPANNEKFFLNSSQEMETLD